MFGNSYQQLQSWPTPKLWEGRRQSVREVSDNSTANLRLSLFTVPTAVAETIADDANAACVLTFWNNGGPIDRSVADDGTASLALTVFLSPSAVTQTQSESANAALALSAFVDYTGAGNRTESDDGTANVALTAWS